MMTRPRSLYCSVNDSDTPVAFNDGSASGSFYDSTDALPDFEDGAQPSSMTRDVLYGSTLPLRDSGDVRTGAGQRNDSTDAIRYESSDEELQNTVSRLTLGSGAPADNRSSEESDDDDGMTSPRNNSFLGLLNQNRANSPPPKRFNDFDDDLRVRPGLVAAKSSFRQRSDEGEDAPVLGLGGLNMSNNLPGSPQSLKPTAVGFRQSHSRTKNPDEALSSLQLPASPFQRPSATGRSWANEPDGFRSSLKSSGKAFRRSSATGHARASDHEDLRSTIKAPASPFRRSSATGYETRSTFKSPTSAYRRSSVTGRSSSPVKLVASPVPEHSTVPLAGLADLDLGPVFSQPLKVEGPSAPTRRRSSVKQSLRQHRILNRKESLEIKSHRIVRRARPCLKKTSDKRPEKNLRVTFALSPEFISDAKLLQQGEQSLQDFDGVFRADTGWEGSTDSISIGGIVGPLGGSSDFGETGLSNFKGFGGSGDCLSLESSTDSFAVDASSGDEVSRRPNGLNTKPSSETMATTDNFDISLLNDSDLYLDSISSL